MHNMFYVRPAHALPPSLQSGPPRACRVRRRRLAPFPPPGPRTSPRIASSSSDSRQYASAFNQPLSFDTSSVKRMDTMFHVRPARALAPSLQTA